MEAALAGIEFFIVSLCDLFWLSATLVVSLPKLQIVNLVAGEEDKVEFIFMSCYEPCILIDGMALYAQLKSTVDSNRASPPVMIWTRKALTHFIECGK